MSQGSDYDTTHAAVQARATEKTEGFKILVAEYEKAKAHLVERILSSKTTPEETAGLKVAYALLDGNEFHPQKILKRLASK